MQKRQVFVFPVFWLNSHCERRREVVAGGRQGGEGRQGRERDPTPLHVGLVPDMCPCVFLHSLLTANVGGFFSQTGVLLQRGEWHLQQCVLGTAACI